MPLRIFAGIIMVALLVLFARRVWTARRENAPLTVDEVMLMLGLMLMVLPLMVTMLSSIVTSVVAATLLLGSGVIRQLRRRGP